MGVSVYGLKNSFFQVLKKWVPVDMIFGVQIKVKSGYQLVYDLKKSFFQVLKKWVLVDIIFGLLINVKTGCQLVAIGYNFGVFEI